MGTIWTGNEDCPYCGGKLQEDEFGFPTCQECGESFSLDENDELMQERYDPDDDYFD